MYKIVNKVIVVIVLMAASLSMAHGQELISSPSGTSLKVKAVFPVPNWVGDYVTTAYATITWYDPYDNMTETQQLAQVDEITFENNTFWVYNSKITHVTYKVWGWNQNETKGYFAEGTFDILGVTNTLIITSWTVVLKKVPDNPS